MKKIYISAITMFLLFSLTMTVYALGWTQENGTWVYYDDNGKVTNTWERSGTGYYYLGADGNMVTNSFIDDRYVDSDGRAVTSTWRQIDEKWYYFDTGGNMVQGTGKAINGNYYYFDYDGAMLTGWIQDENGEWYYYDTSDGHRVSSAWKQLESPEDVGQDTSTNYEGLYNSENDTNVYWFYFRSNGKPASADDTNDFKEYTIGSERYVFDMYGRMCTGWIKLTEADSDTPLIAGYKYYNDDESLGTYGAAHVGWLSAYPPSGDGLSVSNDVVWYYFDARGVPYYGEISEDYETLTASLKRITRNGVTNSYLFNQFGNPVYGIRRVKRGNTITSMYFGTRQECCLQYGETRITEADGTVSTFLFTNSGYGVTGPYDGKLYYMGKLQTLDSGSIGYVQIPGGDTYLIYASGRLRTNYNKRYDKYTKDFKSDSAGRDDGGLEAGSAQIAEEPAFYTSADGS